MSTQNPSVFGIMGNVGKAATLAAVKSTMHYLIERDIPFFVEDEVLSRIEIDDAGRGTLWYSGGRDDVGREADVVMTFGGDGTLLAVIQHTLRHDTPVLGVNLGKLGFLADVGADEVQWAIEEIMKGAYSIEHRLTLKGTMTEYTDSYFALNDIVLAKSGSAKVIRIDAFVDGDFLASFHADGIIISTPTGSTAYSLATGGPVVVPSSDAIVISPISAHTLTARPVIVSGSSRITIKARAEEGGVMVMSDGNVLVQGREAVDAEISRSEHSVALIKELGPNYFETLRRKLVWAQDVRNRKETPAPDTA